MAEAEDWRLTGQERYLAGVVLQWADWHSPRLDWDHDHCEFCWAKFGGPELPEALHAGYATPDRYRWVCPLCFSDFRARFGWQVVGEPRQAETGVRQRRGDGCS